MHRGAALAVVDVALSCWGCLGRGALRLPLEERRADRAVRVHGGRREVFLGLPQVEPEDVGLRVFDSLDAGAAGRRRVGDTEGCKDLGEAVTSVDVERHAATGVDGHGDPADTVAQGVGQFEKLVTSGGVRPQPLKSGVDLREWLVPAPEREVEALLVGEPPGRRTPLQTEAPRGRARSR